MADGAYTSTAVSGGRAAAAPRPVGARAPLGVAGLCLLALALVWFTITLVPAAQVRDAIALHDFTVLSRPRIDAVANLLVHSLKPLLLALWTVMLACIAIARGQPRRALAVVAVVGLSEISAETLKPLLAGPLAHTAAARVGPASWPSGHSTAALALALCAVLVAPRRVRPLVAVAALAFAAAVGCALLILAWHMPSDVLGGYLVAALWTALAVAALRAAERRWPRSGPISQGARRRRARQDPTAARPPLPRAH